MNFQFGRVSLLPETRIHREPVFDVVFMGHADKDADLAKLFANPSMLDDMRAAGYADILDQLYQNFSRKEKPILTHSLYNLPIPLRNLDEYKRLFSVEKNQADDLRYKSRLGGDYVWLPLAVADFFQIDVMKIPRRLWIVPVDENSGVEGFLTKGTSAPGNDHEFDHDNALLRVLNLPNIGLISLPDFERLHVAQSLKHIPHLRIANPLPTFLPCGSNSDDGVSERSTIEKEKPDDSVNFIRHLKRLLQVIAKYRRDVNLLLAFPYDIKMDGELPRSSILAEDQLNQWRQDPDRQLLRHVQLVYPYLQDAQGNITSPCAILAGKILSSTTERGSWRSIAGVDIATYKRPFPSLSIKKINLLRDNPGLALLEQKNNCLQLDDERLSVPYVDDQADTNSGELARFMGWLFRSLEKLGLDLVFESVDTVIKSEILLRNFFGRLYQMGALRGKRSEDAFSVQSETDGDGRVIINIQIAPSIPIDRLMLDFRLENGEFHIKEISHG